MAIQTTGVRFVTEGLGSFLGGIGAATRGFNNFLSNLRSSTGSLTGFSSASRTLGSDLAYLARRVIALSIAYKTLDIAKDAVRVGLEQVVAYDRLSHSLAALTARELIQTGAFTDFGEALKAAQPFAEKTLGWIEKMAIVTIFESEDIRNVQMFGQAVGLSAKDAQAMTLSLAAWGTVTGQQPHTLSNIANALTDMFAKGKVQAEEMRQLARNGIPAWEYLAKALGVNTQELRKMVSEGLVPADVGIKAIVEGLARDFGPALKDFQFSLAGLTSSFRDLTKINLREFFRGAVEAAQPFLERAVSVMMQPEFKERIQELGRSFGELAAKVFSFAEAMLASGDPFAFIALKINDIIPGFFHLFEQLGHLKDTFIDIAKAAFNWGKDISGGLGEGLVAGMSVVVSALQRIADFVLSKIKGIKDSIHSIFSGEARGGAPDVTGGFGDTGPPKEGGDTGKPPELPGEAGSTLGIDPKIFDALGQALDAMNKKARETALLWADMKKSFQEARAAIEEQIPGFEKITPLVVGLGGALGTVLASGAAAAAFELFKLLSPFGLITGAVALAYQAWQENWFGIRDITNQVIPEIQSTIQNLPATIDDVKGKVGAWMNNDLPVDLVRMQILWNKTWPDMEQAAENFSDAVIKALKSFKSEADITFNWFENNAPRLAKIINKVSGEIDNMLGDDEGALKSFADVTGAVLAAMAGDWEGLGEAVKQVVFVDIAHFLELSDQDVVNWQHNLGVTLGVVASTFQETARGLGIVFADLGLTIDGVGKTIASVIGGVSDTFHSMGDVVGQVVGTVSGYIHDLGTVVGTITGFVAEPINAFSNLANSVGGVSNAISVLIGWANTAIQKMHDLAASIPSSLLGHSPSPFETSLLGIAKAMGIFGSSVEAFQPPILILNRSINGLVGQMDQLYKLFTSANWGNLLRSLKPEQLADVLGKIGDLGEKIRKAIVDIQQGIFSSRIGGLGQTIKNMQDLRTLWDAAKAAQEEYLKIQNKLLGVKEEEEDPQVAAENAKRRALVLKTMAEGVETELQGARAEFLRTAQTDPENAQKLFELRSRHIKELADITARIDLEQDADRKQSLSRERDFLIQQQAVELQLFQSQANERQREFEQRIHELGQAWSEIFSQFPQLAAPPWLTSLITLFSQLSGIQLPDWLIPGSPTPLEMGLRGILDAVHQLSVVEIPKLQMQFQTMDRVAYPGQILGGQSSYTSTYSPQFNLGVTTNNSPGVVLQSYELMRSLYAP